MINLTTECAPTGGTVLVHITSHASNNVVDISVDAGVGCSFLSTHWSWLLLTICIIICCLCGFCVMVFCVNLKNRLDPLSPRIDEQELSQLPPRINEQESP